MQILSRKILMGGLVAAFGVQTAFVYTDGTAERLSPLDAEALAGRRIFHAHNCQSCHQIYGFGGFLGPDLTNAAPRLSRERLDSILTHGAGQMPAFHLAPDEIDAVHAYLRALDRTGIGVARRALPRDPQQVFEALETLVEMPSTPAEVRAGWRSFRPLCSGCHVPLQATPLGPFTSADLTTTAARLDRPALRARIREGRIERGMPAWKLDEPVLDELASLVEFLAREREALLAALPASEDEDSAGLPWWEFR
jgi:nitric oxide reductase subunit C